MSLAIKIGEVEAVLIGNVWIDIDPRSFDIDSYEFMSEGSIVHGGGSSGVCASGFAFRVSRREICGPLTAIQAVRMRRPPDPPKPPRPRKPKPMATP